MITAVLNGKWMPDVIILAAKTTSTIVIEYPIHGALIFFVSLFHVISSVYLGVNNAILFNG